MAAQHGRALPRVTCQDSQWLLWAVGCQRLAQPSLDGNARTHHTRRWLQHGGIRGRRLDEADFFLGRLSFCLAKGPALR